jgi:molecular chaperone GrpE
MTEPTRWSSPAGGTADLERGEQPGEQAGEGPVIRDRRRLDPLTGELRHPEERPTTAGGPAHPSHLAEPDETTSPDAQDAEQLAELAQERLDDLLRLQAEFVNYKRRVERDRDLARTQAVMGVLEALLPVLDDIHAARQHGALEGGPFAAIAEKLEQTLSRFGLLRYGEPGETFDPTLHEALVHHAQAELAEGTTEPTVIQVLQPGYRTTDKVLRAARVAVADPP